jgi:aminobenzoyl-glutamate utilization protein B
MSTSQPQKNLKRTCLGCKKRFTPRRRNQESCTAHCRYKRFTQNAQRLRVKLFDTATKVWHYVKADSSPMPCAFFLDRADAVSWAQFLRRRQRKQPDAPRVRFSVGTMLPSHNPDDIEVITSTKTAPNKGAMNNRKGLSMILDRLWRSVLCVTLAVCWMLGNVENPAAQTTDERAEWLRRMDAQAQHYGELSRKIWELAEVGYKEKQSSELLKAELRAAGFQLQANVADIPTAFVASYGSGKPVIGILGEYDALPGLSQEDIPEKKARVPGAGGHGCGHNLFGVASAFAAITAKNQLVEKKLPGTIRFYGTPAEEGGAGKVFMARAGVFSDCDIVLAWHPGDRNGTGLQASLANITAKFRFTGQAAHAASAPDRGRSALDAALLMTHAVDLLREHVPQTTRLHYIITNGGSAPNIVPDFAEVYLYARHPDMPTLDGIWQRIIKCAEAGALATETQMKFEIVGSVYNLLANEPLTNLLDRNLRLVGGLQYDTRERAFAEKLRQTFSLAGALELGSEAVIQPLRNDEDAAGFGSTDVGDVSWIVPTAQFTTATYVPGTPGHSWQSTACTGMSIGRKGMVVAAKTLALSTLELFRDQKQIEAAQADFVKRRAGFEYRSRIPAGQKAPLNYRDK